MNGYDRPFRYDAIPGITTSAPYIDDRFLVPLPLGMALDIQGGVRIDILHRTSWVSPARDAVTQPRVNVQLSPRPGLRLRAAWGRTSKLPALGDLFPAQQYYDVVNVNWYPPDSAERLAVLTTSIEDPTNRRLGFAVGHKREVGFEVDIGNTGGAIGVAAFRDVTSGAVGYDVRATSLLREHFALTDSSIGTGRRPGFLTPAQSVDTVPIFVDRPENLQRIENRGVEWNVVLPELHALQTRAELSGAWTISRLTNDAIDLGEAPRLSGFQLDARRARVPYWVGNEERGERALTTIRMVHHQSQLGLVVTGTVQYFLRERTVQQDATDTLSWAGYVTRSGQLIGVSREHRGESQYRDLRQQRVGVSSQPLSPPPDWLLSLQVAKTMFGEGRLSFFRIQRA